jgi:hypothetical protein
MINNILKENFYFTNGNDVHFVRCFLGVEFIKSSLILSPFIAYAFVSKQLTPIIIAKKDNA